MVMGTHAYVEVVEVTEHKGEFSACKPARGLYA